jgi:hypothetical protein
MKENKHHAGMFGTMCIYKLTHIPTLSLSLSYLWVGRVVKLLEHGNHSISQPLQELGEK